MLFNSLHFLIFFPVVVTLYFVLPQRMRWTWLLAASCYFYMVFIPVYLLILGGTIIIDYCAGRLIERAEGRRRSAYLALSLFANVGILAVFKYYNFLNSHVRLLWHILGWPYQVPDVSILLPIGLSFHTFQAMSYTIEVYRGQQRAERHLGIYALYVMFFPQLVAGPIERPQNMLHQFYERHRFVYRDVVQGLTLMAWGMFKKVVIADRLAVFVDHVYDHPQGYTGAPLAVATAFFAFQIYCDFSGYSDIATGAAQVMGFKLMINFRRPYFSRSVAEFWTRWHVSLSTWFRDYVYIPLGGNRVPPLVVYRNLIITCLLSGLWHGASWTYVIWGGLNGALLIAGVATRSMRARIVSAVGLDRVPRVYALLQLLTTFMLICSTWVFFRAATVDDAVYILTHMGGAANIAQVLVPGWGRIHWALAVALPVGMLALHAAARGRSLAVFLAAQPRVVRWVAYYALCLLTLLLGQFTRGQVFIYFQF